MSQKEKTQYQKAMGRHFVNKVKNTKLTKRKTDSYLVQIGSSAGDPKTMTYYSMNVLKTYLPKSEFPYSFHNKNSQFNSKDGFNWNSDSHDYGPYATEKDRQDLAKEVINYFKPLFILPYDDYYYSWGKDFVVTKDYIMLLQDGVTVVSLHFYKKSLKGVTKYWANLVLLATASKTSRINTNQFFGKGAKAKYTKEEFDSIVAQLRAYRKANFKNIGYERRDHNSRVAFQNRINNERMAAWRNVNVNYFRNNMSSVLDDNSPISKMSKASQQRINSYIVRTPKKVEKLVTTTPAEVSTSVSVPTKPTPNTSTPKEIKAPTGAKSIPLRVQFKNAESMPDKQSAVSILGSTLSNIAHDKCRNEHKGRLAEHISGREYTSGNYGPFTCKTVRKDWISCSGEMTVDCELP